MTLSDSDFIALLNKIFKKNGLSSLLNQNRCEKFLALTKRMLEENEKYNLTAIRDPEKIILNHYADCAVLATKIAHGARLIDVGCGAGFPTLPLAILRDDLSILALDSTAKRIAYVERTAEILALSNVKAVAMRAEDAAKMPEYREAFDLATARAVAEMRVLTELCLPFVKVGGAMMAMKGRNAEIELSASKKAIAILGGRDAVIENVSLSSDTEELSHPIITIQKKQKTPDAYPRAFAQISKKPL